MEHPITRLRKSPVSDPDWLFRDLFGDLFCEGREKKVLGVDGVTLRFEFPEFFDANGV